MPCKRGILVLIQCKGVSSVAFENHLWSAYESLMNLWTAHEQAWFSTPYELHMNPIWTFESPMNKHGFQPPMNHLWTAHEPHMNLWTTHEQAWFLALS
jgi:hypothetical protein